MLELTGRRERRARLIRAGWQQHERDRHGGGGRTATAGTAVENLGLHEGAGAIVGAEHLATIIGADQEQPGALPGLGAGPRRRRRRIERDQRRRVGCIECRGLGVDVVAADERERVGELRAPQCGPEPRRLAPHR